MRVQKRLGRSSYSDKAPRSDVQARRPFELEDLVGKLGDVDPAEVRAAISVQESRDLERL